MKWLDFYPLHLYSVDVASKKLAGLQLERYRVNAGLTPEELGAKVGLSGMTIRRVEQGVGFPTIRTKFRLARELGVDVTEIWPIDARRKTAA